MREKVGRNDPCWCGSGKKYKKCHMREDEAKGGPPAEAQQTVFKGNVTSLPPVPGHIARPEYADTGRPTPTRESCLKTSDDEIARMRKACDVARQVLDTVLAAVEPGITTEALDDLAYAKTIELGAYPSPFNYQNYPRCICTSINEVVCHGIPDDRVLSEGEIVNCDISVYVNGMHGDCSETVFVGEVSPEAKRLVDSTYECMMDAIKLVEPGQPFFAIGRAIEERAKQDGYSVVRDFTGHGIGKYFHMDPQVLHYFSPRLNQRMEPGMTFTIEPMINEGTWRCRIWPDNWTAVTGDLKLSAQFEHTVLVTESGYEILTAGDDLTPWFRR